MKHILAPKHLKLSDSQKEKLFASLNITFRQIPKILKSDPAIANLDVKVGDVIKIERNSQTAGVSEYFRGVIEG